MKYLSGGGEFHVSRDVEINGIQKSAPQVEANFGTTDVAIQNFTGSTIVKVKYKKMDAHATILVQILEFDWRRGSSGAWTHVKFGLEVSSGSPSGRDLEMKTHSGHVCKVDHGGNETVILTDSSTIPD